MFLGNMQILASDQLIGKWPVRRIVLKILYRRTMAFSGASLRKAALALSRPAAFRAFNVLLL